jgi:hypothetical protein
LRLGRGLKTGEAVEIGAEDVALEREVGEFALTLDTDEACVFELFHVMGEGGGADGLRFRDTGAGRGALATADLSEDLVAAGCGEGLGDEGELAVGEGGFLCRTKTLFCHQVLHYPRKRACPGKFNTMRVDIHPALT